MLRNNETGIVIALAVLLPCLAMQAWAEAVPNHDVIRKEGYAYNVVTGRVSLAGVYHRPEPLKVFKNKEFCGPWVANETLLVSAEGGLQNAVVILQPVGGRTSVRPGRRVLDNIQCAFAPHVQVAPLGSELILKNSDPILHTVHARLGKETLFNVGLPTWRQVTKTLGRVGVIKIDCDVLHVWMSAAIVVTTSPYYAITDINGYFSIDQLPKGVYEMEIWHETMGVKSKRISLSEGAQLLVDVVYGFKQEKR